MNLDVQIEWLEEECRNYFEPFNSELIEVLASLRELKRLREEVQVLRNVLIMNAARAKPSRDAGHRCEYRVRLEGVQKSISAALKESPDGQ